MESFRPASDKPKGEVQLQQEQIQYVDNECCQVAVKSTAAKEERMNEAQQLDTLPHAQAQQPQMATATLKRSKGKAAAAASQGPNSIAINLNLKEWILQTNQTGDYKGGIICGNYTRVLEVTTICNTYARC